MPHTLTICITFMIFQVCTSDFKLTVLHTNDLHSKYDSVPDKNGKSKFGIPRVMTFIDGERKNSKNHRLIYLDAGDMFTGSVWFTIHKSNISGDFTRALGADAIAVGNHEFDYGVQVLRKHIDRSGKKLLCCNCDVSKEKILQGKIVPSTILNVQGTKIGIIGYIHRNAFTSEKKYGKVKITDETEPIKKQVQQLKKQGVQIIMGLSHAGFYYDKEVAKKSTDIDIIVGGHSHTYMQHPRSDPTYPTKVKNSAGKTVYIVQAKSFAEYVGKFIATFNNKGEVKELKGRLHPMDSKIAESPRALKILKGYRREVDAVKKKVVGVTYLKLNNTSTSLGRRGDCRRYECRLGNMVTDAFSYYFYRNLKGNYKGVADTVAFINAGAIRSGIDKMNITYFDVITALPYDNFLITLQINGSVLLQVLEFSMIWENGTHKSEFLQYSGIKVVYDFSKAPNKRVYKALARNTVKGRDTLSLIEKGKTYNVITTEYMVQGGKHYNMLGNLKHQEHEPIVDVVAYYLKALRVVAPDLEERFMVLHDRRGSHSRHPAATGSRIHRNYVAVLLSILFHELYSTH